MDKGAWQEVRLESGEWREELEVCRMMAEVRPHTPVSISLFHLLLSENKSDLENRFDWGKYFH